MSIRKKPTNGKGLGAFTVARDGTGKRGNSKLRDCKRRKEAK